MSELVLLRASSGPRVGLGHVARGRAVAEEVRELGGRPLFVVDDELSARWLRAAGFEAACAFERTGWAREPAAGALLDGFVDWTAELRSLSRQGTPSLLLENRTSARERCWHLIYPSLHYTPDTWDLVHGGRVLSGPAWIPLSREVRAARQAGERDVGCLVTFGGGDPLRSTERVLALLEPGGLEVVVSTGPYMTYRRSAIKQAAERCGARVLDPGETLAPWMARARVALTALGTTLYELAYLGVPALVLANYAADGPALEHYARRGPHRPLGLADEISDEDLSNGLARGLAELPQRAVPRIPGLGQGAERIARLLLAQRAVERAA